MELRSSVLRLSFSQHGAFGASLNYTAMSLTASARFQLQYIKIDPSLARRLSSAVCARLYRDPRQGNKTRGHDARLRIGLEDVAYINNSFICCCSALSAAQGIVTIGKVQSEVS